MENKNAGLKVGGTNILLPPNQKHSQNTFCTLIKMFVNTILYFFQYNIVSFTINILRRSEYTEQNLISNPGIIIF